VEVEDAQAGNVVVCRVEIGRSFGAAAAPVQRGLRTLSFQALPPSARYERRVGVSLVRAAWERRPEGPAYLLGCKPRHGRDDRNRKRERSFSGLSFAFE